VLQGDSSSPDFFNQKRAVSGALSGWQACNLWHFRCQPQAADFPRHSPVFQTLSVENLGDMTHFSAGPCFRLAIEMDEHAGSGEPGGNVVYIVADEILHHAVRMAARIAERVAGNRADVLLELRDDAGRLSPVAGIVHAGCDFVRDESAIRQHEEFDADDADIGKA